jgi:hypothetical protein
MKKFFWLATGITVGLIAAKEIEKNPKAKAAYDEATEKLRNLISAFTEGYEEEVKASKPAPKRPAQPKTAK